MHPYTNQLEIPKRILRFLKDPSLLDEHLANQLDPLLERILKYYISDEARLVLHRLSVATIPLGKAALMMLCPLPQYYKELRDISLLVAYTNRAQLLPTGCIDSSPRPYARTGLCNGRGHD